MIIYMEPQRFNALRTEDIAKIVNSNLTNFKFSNLKNYYIGKHPILEQTRFDPAQPNNKVVNNIAKYITDTAVGYFVGMPVAYASLDEDFMLKVQNIFDYNDEQDENTELAKAASIYGSVFEMIYFDEDANIRFTKVDPDMLIAIYSTQLRTLLGAIRIIKTVDIKNKPYFKVEFWTDKIVNFYTLKQNKLEMTGYKEHYYQDVPFIEYLNNEERLGDFEGVTSLIDIYNKVQSNTANIFEYNDQSILKIINMGDVTLEDIKEMKKERAIALDSDGDIDWLLKTVDDTAIENFKKRLRDDIHMFANVPNLTDESFGGNITGVAVSYKLWGLEQICAIKERKFKKGLQRRIELITNLLNLKGGHYNYMDIDMSFRRNKPQNLLEIAQVMTILSSDLSRETRLKMLPIVEDVKDELKKLEDETNALKDNFGDAKAFVDAIALGDDNAR